MKRTLGRFRRAVVTSTLVAGVLAGSLSAAALAATAPPPCDHPVLILSAMPLELNPFVPNAKLVSNKMVRIGDRRFYAGSLSGVPVVLALTGIGPVNATETATAAFEHFRCSFAAVLFSGVAGSNNHIGDVIVPQRWTLNNGRTWVGTDRAMFSVARQLQGSTKVKLIQDLPVGDAACLCVGVDAPTPVHLPQRPQVLVGGAGQTTDPFGGNAAPCVWGGGDIAGCEPCVLTGDALRDDANFSANTPALPGLIGGVFAPAPPATASSTVQDEETGAVDTVAHRYGVPFLGVRAVSDGAGDPLHLPGFPSQFFVYRQLAGNNAAAVTMAFVKAWAAAGRPT